MKYPRAFPALAVLAFPGLALAEVGEAILTLVDDPDFNRIEIGVSPPVLDPSDDISILTGEILVEIDLDPETDDISELTIINGNVSGSPISLSESTFLVGDYDFTSSVLDVSLATPIPPGLVNPATGEFEADQHNFTVTGGTLEGNIRVPLLSIDEEILFNFAEIDPPVSGAGQGIGTVSATLTDSTPSSRTYEATVIFPISVEESIEQSGFTIMVTADGTVKAVGELTVPVTPPDPYLSWAEENGLGEASFTADENGDGVQNGLQWALGLDATESPFPHLLNPAGDPGGTVVFTVTLPAGGSAGDLDVLVSDDPESTPFTPIASGSVSTGNPIPAGTSGTVTINLAGEGTMRFVRLAADAPTP